MSEKTLELDSNSFLAVAIRHGILRRRDAEKIFEHAANEQVDPSDAALSLSMLEMHEVDAVHLLTQPKDLAPGFELTGLIGCGAGGMVFRAHQKALERDVALKTINLRSLASTVGETRIQREAHAIAKLHHPNIVAAFDSGFHQGRFCIAMELVHGETLADYILMHRHVSEPVAWRIARQVASALLHAQQFKIIHRDIKPSNLLLTKAPAGLDQEKGIPFVKVADFGLALERDTGDDNQLTAAGTTLGTPAYVAPEQLQDTHVDQRADIYALGATVFHMLSGEAPCSTQSPMKTIIQKSIGDDRWRSMLPPTVSPASTELFRAMTEIEVDDRVASHEELIARIDALLKTLPTPSGNTPTPLDPWRTPSDGKDGDRISALELSEDASLTATAEWTPTFRQRANRWTIATLGVLLAGGVLIAITTRDIWLDGPGAPSDVATTWNVEGFPTPLFNGQSVPRLAKSGFWSPTLADDGSRVLEGGQGARLTIPLEPPQENAPGARLRIGAVIRQGTQAEIHLMVSGETDPRAVLHLEPGLASVTLSDRRPPNESKIPLPPDDTAEATVFQRIQISRLGKRCTLRVNGEDLGSVDLRGDQQVSAILKCSQGATQFADLDIVSMKPSI